MCVAFKIKPNANKINPPIVARIPVVAPVCGNKPEFDVLFGV